ncbi:transcription regulatory protein SNF2 [Striga asiatica]|uniref:Transcription regulatory protein SNF2 n=1 Tax=Striga asiatica TaxID=4170 RepID=A0A5A7PX21_STRAF|nr:transcription regulatory protein SNF2 [Striga asiatica]
MICEWPSGDLECLSSLPTTQFSTGQQPLFLPVTKTSGGLLDSAHTIVPVNTVSSSEAPRKPPAAAPNVTRKSSVVSARFSPAIGATSKVIPSGSLRSLPVAEQSQIKVLGFPSVNVACFSAFVGPFFTSGPSQPAQTKTNPIQSLPHPNPSKIHPAQPVLYTPPLASASTMSSSNPTQILQCSPNPAHPSQSAHVSSSTQTVGLGPGKSFLSAA